MTDPIPPAPLDAYSTAAPNEPTWTVQGGDPLGAPLLRIWAHFARIQAGAIPANGIEGILEHILKAAQSNRPDVEREAQGLLIRASATEDISWDMDAYRAGAVVAEQPKIPAENSPAELERIDLHDRRVRLTQSINNIIAELTEGRQDLLQRGGFFCGEHDPLDEQWLSVILALKQISAAVEPRRLMKQS